MNPHSSETFEQTRQRVVNELSKAYANSSISEAQLEDHLMATYEAASVDELTAVLGTIPGYIEPQPQHHPQPPRQHRRTGAHHQHPSRVRHRSSLPILPILIVAFVLFNAGAFLWPLFLIPFFMFGGGRGCGSRRHAGYND